MCARARRSVSARAGRQVSRLHIAFFASYLLISQNVEEVNTIVNIVTKYYQQKHFCVITPYDAQRAAITAALKAANVADYEHVYNVDSFQGMYRSPFDLCS